QPGDLVLILPTGGGSGVLQQFTSDPRLLRRAIGRLRPFYFTNATTPYRGLSPSSGVRGSLPGGNIDPFEAADARATLGALNETVKSMSKLPGRKVSVFVSEGFRLLATQTNRELNQTTALAARANVVFYTIDPRGLDPLVLNAADEIERGDDLAASVTDTMNRKRADFFESQDTLNSIALDTGGKFFRNNNDIKRGLDSILEENSAYYMLGFYPEAGKWDGKYHKVKVVVRSRPDLIVSFRKGYLAKSPASEKASIDPAIAEALEAISSPLVRRDIDLRLTPLYLDDAKRDPIVTLLIHIDASKLNFSRAENRYKSKLIQIGFVLDASGKLADRFSETIDLNLQQHTYESALKRGFVATRALNVKPGVYQIRLFVRDGASGLIGTANDYVEVPDLKSGRLATSSLFLGGRVVEQGKVVETAGAAGTPSQRRFQRTGEFSYSLVIYNAEFTDSKQSQLEMKTRIVKGNQTVYNGELRPVQIANGSTPTRVVTGGVIKLSQLEPDHYTLQVTVRDKLRKKNNLVRTEMDFSVE
ncbi:MAG TPA: VWA domain-containing protein, partial [Blastocatellia bacterium]|nr:VWA domain-containing protein [Blastocatellia bacterium]